MSIRKYTLAAVTTVAAGTIAAVTVFSTASAQDAMNPMVGGAEMLTTRNIVENAVNSPIHTTLVAAVQAAGLVETLMGPGPFTVFAPTDEAFSLLPEGAVANLLLPENLELLRTVLTCHVVSAAAMSSAIVGMIADDNGAHPVTTIGGCVLTARMTSEGHVALTDENGTVAIVTVPDVVQSNGVIHVIDRVILPAM